MDEDAKPLAGETDPADESGRRSRGGYFYQDLCALRYCVSAAASGRWQEVWCESHDDIVLFTDDAHGGRFRYAQVKFEFSADQHWSCARLCQCEAKKTIADSVVCKLFGNDRFAGRCDFRLLTNEGTNADLKPFHYRWGEKEPTVDPSCDGAKTLLERLVDWTPPGTTPKEEYVRRFGIEQHAGDANEMEALVRGELGDLASGAAKPLFPDEIDALFRHVYVEVHRAATRSLARTDDPERIVAEEFRRSVLAQAQAIAARTQDVSNESPSEALSTYLRAAGLPETAITTAAAQRWTFRREQRASAGSERGELLDAVLSDVQAHCLAMTLDAVLDPGLTPGHVLQRVLARCGELHAQRKLDDHGVGIALVHGMCYFAIGRGDLRTP
jgi:hypothetical protein